MYLPKARRATLTFLLFLMALLSAEQQQHAENTPTMIWEGNATAIQEIFVDLRAGELAQFETRNVSVKGDPVLNLLGPDGKEVAADDNGTKSFAAKLTYQAESPGRYRLIVRAKTTNAKGTADIYKGTKLLRSNVAFGGMVVPLDAQLRAKEELYFIVPPNGVRNHRFYLLAPDNVQIVTRRPSGGGTPFTANSDTAVGSVVIGAATQDDEGPVRLMRNDAALPGHDPDNDGLGSELERALGTCSSLAGVVQNFNCNRAVDARDTDGDGISDGWEVLGRRFTEHPAPNVNRHLYLPLPKWGADPRHKDLFVEVDYQREAPEDDSRSGQGICALLSG